MKNRGFVLMRRFGHSKAALAVFVMVLAGFVGIGSAYATSGYWHNGGAVAGAQFCANADGSDHCATADVKTRNDSATWQSGYYGYVGLDRNGTYVAYQGDLSGSGYNSTYTSVYAVCGNGSGITYTLSCYTSNL